MSLINDALKKAQRQRTAEPAPPVPSALGPAPSSKRHKPGTVQTLYTHPVAGAGVVLFTILVGVAVWWFAFRAPPAPPPVVRAPVVVPRATAPAVAVAAAVKPAAAGKPAAPAPAEAATIPPPGAPVEAAGKPAPPAPAPASKEPAPPPAVKPAAPAAPPVVPPAAAAVTPEPPPPPKPNPAILVFIDNIRLSGVRSAGAESKILMNDRVYRVNDVVDVKLGLKLTAVQSNALTFVDEHGMVYRKSF